MAGGLWLLLLTPEQAAFSSSGGLTVRRHLWELDWQT